MMKKVRQFNIEKEEYGSLVRSDDDEKSKAIS